MRKSAFCICENKDADQLRKNCTADLRLCFRYMDSTIPLLSKSKISNLLPFSVVAQPGFCQTWLETLKTGFLASQLKLPGSPIHVLCGQIVMLTHLCNIIQFLQHFRTKECGIFPLFFAQNNCRYMLEMPIFF